MSGKAVRETLGFIGVVASMVFVGLEIQQNTAVARAQTRQSLTEIYLDFVTMLATDSIVRQGYLDAFEPGGQTPLMSSGAEYTMWAVARRMENVFLQVDEGVVDESVFNSYGWTDNPVFRGESFGAWWDARRGRFHPDFVAAFEAEYDLAP